MSRPHHRRVVRLARWALALAALGTLAAHAWMTFELAHLFWRPGNQAYVLREMILPKTPFALGLIVLGAAPWLERRNPVAGRVLGSAEGAVDPSSAGSTGFDNSLRARPHFRGPSVATRRWTSGLLLAVGAPVALAAGSEAPVLIAADCRFAAMPLCWSAQATGYSEAALVVALVLYGALLLRWGPD